MLYWIFKIKSTHHFKIKFNNKEIFGRLFYQSIYSPYCHSINCTLIKIEAAIRMRSYKMKIYTTAQVIPFQYTENQGKKNNKGGGCNQHSCTWLHNPEKWTSLWIILSSKRWNMLISTPSLYSGFHGIPLLYIKTKMHQHLVCKDDIFWKQSCHIIDLPEYMKNATDF